MMEQNLFYLKLPQKKSHFTTFFVS